MGLSGAKVGIIGGKGRMGSWFARLLEEHGMAVFCAGHGANLSPREMVGQCRIVVVSVPIAATIKVIQEIAPLVPRDGLLLDLTSIKKPPMDAMLRYSRAQVVGLHPLFGPSPEGRDLSIVVCRGRGQEGLDWVSGVLRKSGIRLVFLEPEAHDRMMGLIQGVNHFTTLALALTIEGSGYSMKALLDCSTRTFRLHLDRIRTMLEQPAGLFASLMMDNPCTEKSLNRYLQSCGRLERITRDGDRKAFQRLFDSLGDFFNREEEKT